jgi:hypothetical protein
MKRFIRAILGLITIIGILYAFPQLGSHSWFMVLTVSFIVALVFCPSKIGFLVSIIGAGFALRKIFANSEATALFTSLATLFIVFIGLYVMLKGVFFGRK